MNENLKEKIKNAVLEIADNPWHKGTIKVEGRKYKAEKDRKV